MADNKLVVRNDLDLMTLGGVLAKSGFFTDSKSEAQAIVKVLAGQELGFGPVASMTGIFIVKGRVTLSANLMAAAVKRSGKYNYRIVEHTDTECALEFFEDGESVGVSKFTKQDAAKAKLSGDNWTKYPRNMLFARAMSNGAKFYCPDIFGGPIYTPDELGAEIDGENGEIVDGDYTVHVDETGDVVLPQQGEIVNGQKVAPAPVIHNDCTVDPPNNDNPDPTDDRTSQDVEDDANAFPTIKRLWGHVASNLQEMKVSDLPMPVGGIIYPVATSQLGYQNDAHVKSQIELDSLNQFQGTLGALMVRVIDRSPTAES